MALIVPERVKLTGLGIYLAQRIILGTEHVPIGQYTEELIQKADILWGDGYSDTVWSKVVSRESNARLVRAKVELGEADAAIVYQTDAMASSSLKMFPIPSSFDIQAQYHIGHTLQAEPMAGVHAWDEWLQSESARDILQHHGLACLMSRTHLTHRSHWSGIVASIPLIGLLLLPLLALASATTLTTSSLVYNTRYLVPLSA